MEQLDFLQQTNVPVSVTDLTRRLRGVIESEDGLQNVWVQGELSNFSRPKSGHWYFTLKDDGAQLPCVMWRSTAELQIHVPKDGESLEVHGGLSLYEAGGRYQLYVDEIRPAGAGALYLEFLKLKTKLEAEGLFAAERKRAVPAAPRRIGIVSSPTGAALRDIVNTLTRRYPLVEVFLAGTQVQGPTAAAQVRHAIQRLNHYVVPDVIILARGGGSLEDLAAFNSEMLARAIVASAAPIICGVGHETDFTIADFVADLRAPTPTAAAELATPDRFELAAGIAEQQLSLGRALADLVREKSWELDAMAQRLQARSPEAKISSSRQRLDDLTVRSERALQQQSRLLRANLGGLQSKLGALNPTDVLSRGYAVVSQKDGKVVSRAKLVKSGETLKVQVSDGDFGVTVNDGSK